MPEENIFEECYIAVKINELQMYAKVHKLISMSSENKQVPDEPTL